MSMKPLNALVFACVLGCLTSFVLAQQKQKNSDIENIGNRDINKGSINLVSIEKEVAIGRQLSAAYEREIKLSDNFAVNEYINRLGQNIVRNSDATIPFSFKVVASDLIDGETFPGGFIYISTGTIRATDNEAELASILAQQIAHVAARHSMENSSKAELVNFANVPAVFEAGVGGIALRPNPRLAPTPFVQMIRQQVMEADYLGVQYLYKSGYDPRAAITFLQKLQASSPLPNPQSPSTMQSAEPPLADRITALEKNIATILPPRDQNVLTTSEFANVRTLVVSTTR